MSEGDSFIQEVSEEVRRERLYGYLRRYGWIGILAVLVIVGGAAANEWRKARAEAEARATGDALLAALEAGSPEARQRALAGIEADGGAADVVSLLLAAERLAAEDRAGAAEALRPLAGDTEAPAVYSDLAALKLVMLGEDGVDATTRAQLLDRLTGPGAPYRLLAREQRALAHLAAGRRGDALGTAQELLQEPGLPQGLRQRMSQLIVALGGELPRGGGGE